MSRRGARRLIAGAALLPLAAAAAEYYAPGSANDPRVRVADYLAANGRYLGAASLLQQMRNEAPDKKLAPWLYLRLADDVLSYGMEERAETIYREQLARSVAAEGKEAEVAARTHVRLAEFNYQRGYFPQAVEELRALRDKLPPQLFPDWQDLMARALAAQGQYGEAADVLEISGKPVPESAYARYNLGISLINDGRVAQGTTMLDRVGRMSVFDSETLALRDKANLTLGYHFLRSQQGGTSVPIFNRVRSAGPYSNRALLGLGWAYLAPRGSSQHRVQLSENEQDQNAFSSFSTLGSILRPGFLDTDIYNRAGMRSFYRKRLSKDQDAMLKQALVPWLELLSRDPMDPAVQEGMLAIPYALDQLNAHIQAKEFYEKAIPALQETRKRLDEAEDHVRSGRMVETIVKRDADAESGWTWRMTDLPDAPETFYLQSLLAEHRYQEALKNYRDARLLVRNFDGWRRRIADLQHSFVERPPSETPVELLFAQAKRRNLVRLRLDPPPVLREDRSLRPYTEANVAAEPNPPLALRLTEAMPKFDGPYERMQALAARIDALRPQLETLAERQSKLLEVVAMRELESQKKINEKYQVDARFALARIYDKAPRGEAP